MAENTTEIPQKTATQWFYERIKELKPKLPANYKMPLLALLPKEYDTAGGGRIIQDVLQFRTTDVTVLEAIEKLIAKNQ